MLLERLDVVVDAVNPVAAARQGWVNLAAELEVDHFCVHVVCSDLDLHRSRIEERSADLPGHEMPTWSDVVQLEYEPWSDVDIVVDSAGVTGDAVEAILARFNQTSTPSVP